VSGRLCIPVIRPVEALTRWAPATGLITGEQLHGIRDDIVVHQQYIADIEANARQATARVDPTRYFAR
jgi:hypothetical protein